MKLVDDSLAHLEGVDEDYVAHMRFAAAVGRHLVVAGFACLIHALVPALFPTTASTAIRDLHALIESRSTTDAAFQARGEEPAGFFLLLLLLSAYAALLPWVVGAGWMVALPLSLMSAAFPLAFLLGRDSEPRQAAQGLKRAAFSA